MLTFIAMLLAFDDRLEVGEMVVSHIKPCTNIVGAIRYIRDSKPHREGGERYLAGGGNGVTFENAEKDMLRVIERQGNDDRVPAYSMIVSFSKDELKGDSYDDIEKADKIIKDFLTENYGTDRQWFYVLQNDGESGLLHSHIVISGSSMSDGSALQKRQVYWRGVKHDLRRAMERNGVEDVLKDLNKRRKTFENEDRYYWQNDLKRRIDSVLDGSNPPTDWEGLKTALGTVGVVAEIVKSGAKNAYIKPTETPTGVKEKGYIIKYKFDDEEGTPRKARGTTLGVKYGLAEIDKRLEQNEAVDYQEDMFDFINTLDVETLRNGLATKPVTTNNTNLVTKWEDLENDTEHQEPTRSVYPATSRQTRRKAKTVRRRNFNAERELFEAQERARIAEEEERRRAESEARLDRLLRETRLRSRSIAELAPTERASEYELDF